MKKIFAVCVFFAALIFVAGCGSSSKNEDETDTGDSVTDEDRADTESNDAEPADTEPDTDQTNVADDLCSKSEAGTIRIGDEPCGPTGEGKLYQECGEDGIWHYTDKCSDNSGEEEKPDTDEPVSDDDGDPQNDADPLDNDADNDSAVPEEYSDCMVNSSEPCYTVCSEGNDGYFAWLNGTLVNRKCKDNSCTVSGKKVGVEPDTCEQYSVPPESCNPETSATLCAPDGGSVWKCDSDSFEYYADSCGTGDHCVQCQNRAGCIPVENCTGNSTKNCNSVCNAEGDGYYIWDWNTETLMLLICPQKDCIHTCGTAECQSGTGYIAGDSCESSFKYCTSDGAFAFTCKEGRVDQKKCKNSDCVYDAVSGEITSCTAE